AYSDFATRLPRGRSYLRNGCVVDLKVARGEVKALVSGTELYEVRIAVGPLPAERWRGIVGACAGEVASMLGLLGGKLSAGVAEAEAAALFGIELAEEPPARPPRGRRRRRKS